MQHLYVSALFIHRYAVYAHVELICLEIKSQVCVAEVYLHGFHLLVHFSEFKCTCVVDNCELCIISFLCRLDCRREALWSKFAR